MKHMIIALTVALTPCLTAAATQTVGELTDPYEILDKHIEALGGWAEVTSDLPVYTEATIHVSGLSGSLKDWQKPPLQKRTELDLKVFRQTSGDNGLYSWSVDQNGKVQIARDEPTLQRRQLAELQAKYEHLKPESPYFDMTFVKLDTANGQQCYVVRTTNTINDDIGVAYYNVSTFLIERSDGITPDQSSVTRYSDYRSVGGVKAAFRQEIVTQPGDQQIVVEIDRIERGIEIPRGLFEPPQQDAKDYRFTSGNSAEDVRFEYLYDHLFLPVTINGRERLWFLDTGAGASVIDSAFAAELGLASHAARTRRGARELCASYSFVQLPAFSTPGIEFSTPDGDQHRICTASSAGWGWTWLAILGFDFLSLFVVRVSTMPNNWYVFMTRRVQLCRLKGSRSRRALMNNTFHLPRGH
jgi:hypothetical protein